MPEAKATAKTEAAAGKKNATAKTEAAAGKKCRVDKCKQPVRAKGY